MSAGILELVHEDDNLIAINKPHGLLVHPSPIARNTHEFALQLLRDQVGYRVYPAHRLDRKTSGVLLFAKNKEALSEIRNRFEAKKVKKVYHALVRGYIKESGTIDYPLTNEKGKTQDSITHYRLLNQFEIPFPSGGHATSRYSLVELRPVTGRHHQLRKHMAHIFHPIIGDRPHGCNKQNRIWKHEFGMDQMFLHAKELEVEWDEDSSINIQADYSQALSNALDFLSPMK